MKLTQDQAIEQGYKYCTPQHKEIVLIPIQECDFESRYVLIQKEGRPFQIPDDLLSDLLNDHVDSQESVDNESGTLNDILGTINFGPMTEVINKAFADTSYYFATDIQLIYEHTTLLT